MAGDQMGPKLLFVFGIVAVHGAVGAVWMRQETPLQRLPVTTCVQSPAEQPYFQPKMELLAMWVAPATNEDP